MKIVKGSKIIYEDKRCEVESITDTKVVLINLDKKDELDWSRLEIKLEELSQ